MMSNYQKLDEFDRKQKFAAKFFCTWHNVSSQKEHIRQFNLYEIEYVIFIMCTYLYIFYCRNLIFYSAFVAFITCYIFVLYSGKTVRSDSIIVQNQNCSSTETVVKGDVSFLWVATTICWGYLITREFLQFVIAPKRYIFTLGNSSRGIYSCSGATPIFGTCLLESPGQQFQ